MVRSLLLLLLLLLLAGGPVLAQPPQGGPPAQTPAAAAEEETDPLTQLVEAYSSLSSLSFRVGNFLGSARILKSFEDFILSCAKLAPGHESDVATAQLGLSVLQFVNLAFAGQPTSAIELGNKLLQNAGTDEDINLVLRMVLLFAGRAAGRPQVVDQNLPIVLKMCHASKDESAGLYKFAAETLKFDRELEKNPSLSDAAFIARHNQIWPYLESYRVGEESMGDGRLMSEALRFWLTQLTTRATLTGNEAEKTQLKALIDSDLNKATTLAAQALDLPNKLAINPEFFAGVVDAVLDVAETMRRLDDVKGAHEVLAAMDKDLGELVKMFEAADVEVGARLDEAVATFNTVLPQMQEAGVVFDPKPFKFSLMDGDISRLQARYHQQWVRQIMAEAGSNPTDAQVEQIKQHLTVAAQAQQKAGQGQGYLGMDDVGWDILEVLFARRREGWVEAAQSQLKNELDICTALNYRPGMIAALSYLGQLHAAQANKQAAMDSLKRATGLAEEYIVEVGGTSAAAGRVRDKYKKAYDLLAQLQIETNQTDEAFSTLGRLQQMQSVASTNLEGNQATSKLVALRGQSQALQQELVARKAAGQDTRPVEQLLAQTKAEFHTALVDIRRQNPQYESKLAIRPVNFSKLQQFIPADAAIIQYFPAETALYIFVATDKDLKIHKVDIPSARLDQKIQLFRRLAVSNYLQYLRSGGQRLGMDSTGPDAEQLIAPLKEILFSLNATLLEPLESDIASKRVVAFIPTGTLNYLPLACLARPAGKGVEFLAQRKQCVTLLKSSDLDQLGHTPTAGKGSLLALGNPDGSLPAADQEVADIAKIFNSRAFVGREATVDKLAKTPGVAYLHLATHGVLDARDPASSYLLMAGGADARLRIPQIYELQLNGVRLVTLSACQTALGNADQDLGSELTTLADAFSIAGTNSVVASLWSVSDKSTEELMVEFYSQIKSGKSLAAALQAAEVKLITSGDSHPFYWAPFVLIGDWR